VSKEAEVSLQELIVKNMGLCRQDASLLKHYCNLSSRRITDRVGRFCRLLRGYPDTGLSRPTNDRTNNQQHNSMSGMFVLRLEQQIIHDDATTTAMTEMTSNNAYRLYLIWQNCKDIDSLSCNLIWESSIDSRSTDLLSDHRALLKSIRSLTFTKKALQLNSGGGGNRFSICKSLSLSLTGLYPSTTLAACMSI